MATITNQVGDGATKDYDNLVDYIATVYNGVDQSGNDLVIEITGLADQAATADFTGSTGKPNSITIKALAGEEPDGVIGGGCKISMTAAGYIYMDSAVPFTLQDVEIDGGGNLTGSGLIRTRGTDALTLERCILHNTSAANWVYRGIDCGTANTVILRNSIFFNLGGSGFGCKGTAVRTVTVEGCAFYNCNKKNDADSGGLDFYQLTSGSTITVRNCIALGNTREDFVDTTVYDTFTNSMSSDTSAGTSNNNHQSETDTSIWTLPGSDDFTLKASTNATLGGATITALTPDIAGTSRPQGAAYDMGPFERAVTGGSTTILTHMMQVT